MFVHGWVFASFTVYCLTFRRHRTLRLTSFFLTSEDCVRPMQFKTLSLSQMFSQVIARFRIIHLQRNLLTCYFAAARAWETTLRKGQLEERQQHQQDSTRTRNNDWQRITTSRQQPTTRMRTIRKEEHAQEQAQEQPQHKQKRKGNHKKKHNIYKRTRTKQTTTPKQNKSTNIHENTTVTTARMTCKHAPHRLTVSLRFLKRIEAWWQQRLGWLRKRIPNDRTDAVSWVFWCSSLTCRTWLNVYLYLY